MTRPRHSARSTQRDRTHQSGAVRSPHTAHSFVSDPEHFRGVIPAGDLRDLLTTILDEESPVLVAAALETRVQDLQFCSLPRSLVLQVPSRHHRRTC